MSNTISGQKISTILGNVKSEKKVVGPLYREICRTSKMEHFVDDSGQNEHEDRLPLEILIHFAKKIKSNGPKLRFLEGFKEFFPAPSIWRGRKIL